MLNFSPIYNYPIWLVGLIFVFILASALEGGFRVGLSRREHWKDADSGGGAVVLTSMFAILGLLLAFTYASGVSRFDARKNAVIIEANALGTAFHRADLVAEPGRTELRKKLLNYAYTRVIPKDVLSTAEHRNVFLKTTLNKLNYIWPATKRIIEQGKPGPIEVALVAAINAVIDAHTLRFTAALDKLPSVVMWMLVFVAAASLSVAGYNAGIQGRMSRWRMSTFAIVLTGLMLVILDFDRPNEGLVKVNNFSVEAVVAAMEAEIGH